MTPRSAWISARFRRGRRVLVALALASVAGGWAAAGTIPGAAAAAVPLPVSASPMADPGVLLDSNHFYGFSTGAGLLESDANTASGSWPAPADELSGTSPTWINTKFGNWAPDMIKTMSGGYVVYFAAKLNPNSGTSPASETRCIGTATSASPNKNFIVDQNPLVCLPGYGAADDMTGTPPDPVTDDGAIDPSPVFVTIDGAQELFLLYKTQGPSGESTIRMVRLSDTDGTTVLGDSHELLTDIATTGLQADTIEGPSLIQNGSWFVLFVAHGNFDTCNYSTEWFKSQHIWSWTNTGGTTLLDQASTGLCGPGGADVTGSEVSGQDRLFLHGWIKPGSTTVPAADSTDEQGTGAKRFMYAAVLTFGSDGYTPSVSFLAPSS